MVSYTQRATGRDAGFTEGTVLITDTDNLRTPEDAAGHSATLLTRRVPSYIEEAEGDPVRGYGTSRPAEDIGLLGEEDAPRGTQSGPNHQAGSSRGQV